MNLGLHHFLLVSAMLFGLGIFCILVRRNAVAVLMGVELILNAANLNFVAFSHYSSGKLDGQVFALFGIVLAAAGAAVALAIVLVVYRNLRSIDVRDANQMRG